MKEILFVFGAAMAITGCASSSSGYDPYEQLRQVSLSSVALYAASVKEAMANDTPQQIIEKGKKALAEKLKDPDSAKFRNVRLVKYLDSAVICGEINGKNSYGGYVGFVDFVGGINNGTMRNRDKDQYIEITKAANTGIDRACAGEEFTQYEKT